MNAGEITLRLRSNLGLKLVLSFVLTVGIWAAYLFLQRHAMFPVTVLKLTSVDRMIPFAPGAVYLYESLLLLMPIAPWLMTSRAELGRYTGGLTLISLVGFIVFVVYPTASPRPASVQGANALYATLVRIDNDLNAFPSLHAAFAVFHGACCHALFRRAGVPRGVPWLIWVWVAGIVASTLLTKQHVVIDVAAGVLLGFGGYAVCRMPPRATERQTRCGCERNRLWE